MGNTFALILSSSILHSTMETIKTTSFIPGAPVVQFETKTGAEVLVRYPRWEDLPQLLQFINSLSAEDTYVALSGEQLTFEEEADFLLNWFKRMEFGDGVYLVCESDEHIVGGCGIERVESDRTRGEHVGSFGLSIAKEFRGQGLGENLSKAAIEEAKTNMPNLQIITLTAFAENIPAVTLYKKLGFIETGRMPGGYKYKKKYQDKTEMCLMLQ